MKARGLLVTAIVTLSLCAQTATNRPKQPPAGQAGVQQQPKQPRPYQHREDFCHASTKLVNPKDFDYGAWIEERRRALLDASVANPFFWYSALTTGLVMLLMMMYSVRVLGEKRKLWRAAEILTDVWNQDQQSRVLAATAVDKYNRHMEECNRVVEAQLSGRPSPAALETSDAKEQLEKVRAERDTLDSDNKRLNAELQKKEKLISEMSARLDVLERRSERASGGAGPPAGGDTVPKLVARVNELQQQLDAERLKNRQFKGA